MGVSLLIVTTKGERIAGLETANEYCTNNCLFDQMLSEPVSTPPVPYKIPFGALTAAAAMLPAGNVAVLNTVRLETPRLLKSPVTCPAGTVAVVSTPTTLVALRLVRLPPLLRLSASSAALVVCLPVTVSQVPVLPSTTAIRLVASAATGKAIGSFSTPDTPLLVRPVIFIVAASVQLTNPTKINPTTTNRRFITELVQRC